MTQALTSQKHNNNRLAIGADASGGELQQVTAEQQQMLQAVLANQDVRALIAAVVSPDADVTSHFVDAARDIGTSCEFSETVEITIED